jgi:hypothetical protein
LKLTDSEKKETIREAWLCGKNRNVPFIVETGEFHAATKTYFDSDINELSWNENYHHSMTDVEDYNFPNIKVNMGIGVMAAAFGCEYLPNDEADPWCKALITDDNINEINKIEIPDLNSCPIFNKSFDRIRFFELNSKLPLRLVNVPSPLVTASLIWDYTSFIEGTLTHPKEVHQLLEMITDATIDFVKKQIEEIRHLYTMGHEPWYIPSDVGIRISDDTAAVMSPSTYIEFGVRYNQKISDAFGGIIIHSCGDITHVLPAMTETAGIRGIDLVMPQNNWQKVKDATAGKVSLCMRHYYWDHSDSNVDLLDYSKNLIDFFGKTGALIITSTPTYQESIDLSRNLQQISRQ